MKIIRAIIGIPALSLVFLLTVGNFNSTIFQWLFAVVVLLALAIAIVVLEYACQLMLYIAYSFGSVTALAKKSPLLPPEKISAIGSMIESAATKCERAINSLFNLPDDDFSEAGDAFLPMASVSKWSGVTSFVIRITKL